jgi:hypothetical protein
MSRRGAVLEGWQAPRPMTFEGLERTGEIAAQQGMHNASLKQRDAHNKQAQGQDLLGSLKAEESGLTVPDNISQSEINRLKEETTKRLAAGESPMSVQMWLQPEVAKLHQAYVYAKNQKDVVDKTLPEIAKGNKYGDVAKLK